MSLDNGKSTAFLAKLKFQTGDLDSFVWVTPLLFCAGALSTYCFCLAIKHTIKTKWNSYNSYLVVASFLWLVFVVLKCILSLYEWQASLQPFRKDYPEYLAKYFIDNNYAVPLFSNLENAGWFFNLVSTGIYVVQIQFR